MPSPAALSKTQRLAMYARPLRPTRPPFYVQHPTAECPMLGWWWQPADAEHPQPLGAQYDLVVAHLHTLLQQPRKTAA